MSHYTPEEVRRIYESFDQHVEELENDLEFYKQDSIRLTKSNRALAETISRLVAENASLRETNSNLNKTIDILNDHMKCLLSE